MRNILSIFAAAALLFSSCSKDNYDFRKEQKGMGSLTFESGFSISVSDDVDTKASTEAGGAYIIKILDEESKTVVSTNYETFKSEQGYNSKIDLPAGNYTLFVSSSAEQVPFAEFEDPIYSASKEFSIEAGSVTSIGAITCYLTQCKVTVGYNDEFKAMVTGNGSTTVTVTAGYPLVYALTYQAGKVSYDSAAGYFAVPHTPCSMEVKFKGNIEGKSQSMTKIITGIAPKQFRKITWLAQTNKEGNATFQISIDGYVEDVELSQDVADNEQVIGDDPNAPTGDGGITLAFDYAKGCDTEFTDFSSILIPKLAADGGRDIKLKLYAEIPNGVRKFTVEIHSTSEVFESAVGDINDGSTTLDLVNPTEGAKAVFTQILPFPYGEAVAGKTNIDFDLSDAQSPLVAFPGTHTFTMHVTDNKGCKKDISLNLIVEE